MKISYIFDPIGTSIAPIYDCAAGNNTLLWRPQEQWWEMGGIHRGLISEFHVKNRKELSEMLTLALSLLTSDDKGELIIWIFGEDHFGLSYYKISTENEKWIYGSYDDMPSFFKDKYPQRLFNKIKTVHNIPSLEQLNKSKEIALLSIRQEIQQANQFCDKLVYMLRKLQDRTNWLENLTRVDKEK